MELSNDLDLNITRNLMLSSDEEIMEACLNHVEINDLLAFRKLNLFSVAVSMGMAVSL